MYLSSALSIVGERCHKKCEQHFKTQTKTSTGQEKEKAKRKNANQTMKFAMLFVIDSAGEAEQDELSVEVA